MQVKDKKRTGNFCLLGTFGSIILRLMRFVITLSLSFKVAIKTVSGVKSWHTDFEYLVNEVRLFSPLCSFN